ncbi:hypothetical protein ACU42Y_00325 [Proteus mirabilis]
MAGSVLIDNKEQKIYGDLFGTTRLSFGNLAQLNDTLMVILSSQLDTLKSRGIKKQILFMASTLSLLACDIIWL